MTEKELRKLRRVELLELFLEQCRKNEALEKEVAELKAQLESKTIAVEQSGSIAEAALNLTKVFDEAQKAADLYLDNIKRKADEDHGQEQQVLEQDNEGASQEAE